MDSPIWIVYQLGKQATVPDELLRSPIFYDSMDKSADFQPSSFGKKLLYHFLWQKNIFKMTRMHKMHPYSIFIIFLGFTLALAMLLLVWQPMSLQNTTRVHIVPCW